MSAPAGRMRAQVFHGPGDLRFEDAPIPSPGPGEAVVRVEAALTCGTDVKTLRRGHPVMIPAVPTVFGHEFAGVGRRRRLRGRGLAEGDRVAAANSAPVGHVRLPGGRPTCARTSCSSTARTASTSRCPPAWSGQHHADRPALPAFRAAFAEPLACAMLGWSARASRPA